MLRRMALATARSLPDGFKTWVHHTPFLDRFTRRLYGQMVGSGVSVIASGPMKGLRLAMGPHVSHAHVNGVYEADTLQAIDQQLQPGFICYDLGASIGYVSLLMARKAKHVYAFEPAPHAVAEIQRHFSANRFTNISVTQAPVSGDEREVSFALTDASYGSAINQTETRWEVLKLRTTTLDRFIEKNPLPDFIKIDVEGEEGPVLEGARKLLQQKRPIICCELHSREAAAHVCAILNEFDYRICSLDGKPFVPPREVLPGEVHVMCVPR